MKELTLEQKAQRYNEAFEEAKMLYRDANTDQRYVLEGLFPELAEIEDEKIRRVIRGWIYTQPNSFFDNGISKEEMLVWLEKQGEQKSIDNLTQQEAMDIAVAKCFDEQKSTEEYNITGIGSKKAQGKLGEMINNLKTSNKFEPKFKEFKEGEWIINGDYTWKILEATPIDYILQSQDGNIIGEAIFHVDGQFHLWSIQDAKEGDVLFYNHQQSKWIFIFKHLYSSTLVSYYIMFTEENKIYIDDSISTSSLSRITPATKEQRDTLMKAMTDAGFKDCWKVLTDKEF